MTLIWSAYDVQSFWSAWTYAESQTANLVTARTAKLRIMAPQTPLGDVHVSFLH